MPYGLEHLDVRGCRALGTFLGLVAHLGALAERLEAAALDRAVVNEEVLAAVVGRDESKALVVTEPLHSSCRHLCSPSGVCAMRDAEGAERQQLQKREHGFSRTNFDPCGESSVHSRSTPLGRAALNFSQPCGVWPSCSRD